jgi:hypothetical protein
VKVGDLVRYLGKEVPVQWLGIIIGFDEEGDPIVRSSLGLTYPRLPENIEVVSEGR